MHLSVYNSTYEPIYNKIYMFTVVLRGIHKGRFIFIYSWFPVDSCFVPSHASFRDAPLLACLWQVMKARLENRGWESQNNLQSISKAFIICPKIQACDENFGPNFSSKLTSLEMIKHYFPSSSHGKNMQESGLNILG